MTSWPVAKLLLFDLHLLTINVSKEKTCNSCRPTGKGFRTTVNRRVLGQTWKILWEQDSKSHNHKVEPPILQIQGVPAMGKGSRNN